jgi:parallel beta-helix repeat protein
MDTQTNPSPESARRAWAATLLLQRPELLNRFQTTYQRLSALPRAARRRLRKATVSLAGAALLLGLSAGPLLVPRAYAANIAVGGACTLVDAIRSANTDAAVGGCAAGSGADTITLTGDVTLTASQGYYYGDETGLPLVSSTITLEGAGHTIARDGVAPEFRLLALNSSAQLTLHDVTLSGGAAGARSGGAIFNNQGILTVLNSSISDNYADLDGGGIFNSEGTVTITDSTISGNDADKGGGWYNDRPLATTIVTGSTIRDNYAKVNGGGFYNDSGTITVIDSIIADNTTLRLGGGLYNFRGLLTITGSSITGNSAADGGGIYNDNDGQLDMTNSTVSGNTTDDDGGGIYTDITTTMNLTNVTITDNTAGGDGGGIRVWNSSTTTLVRTIVSGNSASLGDEVARNSGSGGAIIADDHNVFGHSGISNADAFYNLPYGASDVTATSDGTAPTALAAILDTTLTDNGGPTETHNLVADSPAVDIAPGNDCTAAPTGGVDQRGAPRPFGAGCDAGAVEFGSPVPGNAIYVSALSAGTTDDAVAFGPHDILKWDGAAWSKWFDGSAAGLMPNGKAMHNINALWIPDTGDDDVVLSFVQNARFVNGISGKVDGMDLVWWGGDSFSLWFDGQDVGLNNLTKEKIDALHVLDGSVSPIGGSCDAYLLISTAGDGQVPNHSGGVIQFDGTDVLGFCLTNSGANTAGFWHRVLNGKAEGMPGQALVNLSASDDGQVLYLTTRAAFNVDSASGGHSMVYRYDVVTSEFSGPFFSAPANGLHNRVDGLQVEGDLE